MGRRVRRHEGTVADTTSYDRPPLILKVIGARPKNPPYLAVMEPGERGRVLATVCNANALRGLARTILRSLGEAP